MSQPVYINLIRDPLERLVSWFYYRRTNSPLRRNRLGYSILNMVNSDTAIIMITTFKQANYMYILIIEIKQLFAIK